MAPSNKNQNLSTRANLEIVQNDIGYIREDLAAIKKALQDTYVTKDQFAPVRKIAYGAVTFLGLLVVGAIGALATLLGARR